MRKFLLLLCTMLCVVACEPGKNPVPEPQPEPTPEESQPAYKVGDLYDVDGVKGLIFRVNDDGKSGLIVSLTEAPTKLAWSTELVVTNATSRKNGAENCEKIMTIADWSTQAIVKNKATHFSSGKYLSSTEMDQYWMYYVDFDTFITDGNYKQFTYNIRAIHAF